MISTITRLRLSRTFPRFLFILFLICSGCGRSGDNQVVDFNKTIPVARPGEQPPAEHSLRVAVGAMISPKETFVYYRQILDYMGRRNSALNCWPPPRSKEATTTIPIL
jgi:phosphonate transport system substrate-binding protein